MNLCLSMFSIWCHLSNWKEVYAHGEALHFGLEILLTVNKKTYAEIFSSKNHFNRKRTEPVKNWERAKLQPVSQGSVLGSSGLEGPPSGHEAHGCSNFSGSSVQQSPPFLLSAHRGTAQQQSARRSGVLYGLSSWTWMKAGDAAASADPPKSSTSEAWLQMARRLLQRSRRAFALGSGPLSQTIPQHICRENTIKVV